jgi:hypothetical protein
MTEFLAFDLEISHDLPEGADDWKAHRPLGITCAAACDEKGEVQVWHPGKGLRSYGPALTPAMAARLVRQLAADGRLLVTWNGLGFDLDVLQEEAYFKIERKLVRNIALDGQADIAFQMLCEKGFMCGLAAASKGMGLAGKTEGMSGAKAPAMWKEGLKSQEKVLEYVAQDARATAELYQAILEAGKLTWITKKGYPATWEPTMKNGRLLTCRECLELPLPKKRPGWTPWPREKFAGWALAMEAENGKEA